MNRSIFSAQNLTGGALISMLVLMVACVNAEGPPPSKTKQAADQVFTIAVIPDTQNYPAGGHWRWLYSPDDV